MLKEKEGYTCKMSGYYHDYLSVCKKKVWLEWSLVIFFILLTVGALDLVSLVLLRQVLKFCKISILKHVKHFQEKITHNYDNCLSSTEKVTFHEKFICYNKLFV